MTEHDATIRNQTLDEVYDFSNMSFRTGFTKIVSIKVNDEFVAYGYPGYELILLNKSLRSTEAHP